MKFSCSLAERFIDFYACFLQPPGNIKYAALVIGGSFIIEGAFLVVATGAVRKGAAAEGMKVRDYVWGGHDPTSVAVVTEVIVVCSPLVV
ncbi:metal tolerance protein C4-like [Cornus florida]|uniref:metal tolerance protein C4-like n=1 Tax=Cornus florida TaxID=4283 RepID=UPI00289B03BB|nr:metal tolerance protein C4-like [Cornus florida]